MPRQNKYFNCLGYKFDELTADTHSNKYWNKVKQDECYKSDFRVNCSGDCTITADGTDLKTKEPFSIVACPPTMKHGQKLWIENIGYVVCADRGGAIKGKRLDLWAGIGQDGLNNILAYPETSGLLSVIKLD